jgi:hypothetical protein
MSLALAFIIGVTVVVASGLATSKRNVQTKGGGIVVGSEKNLLVTEYNFNDAGSGALDVWSASKIQAFLKKNGPAYASDSAVSGNVAFFSGGSELVDKGIIINDSLPASANVLWTSAKLNNTILETSANLMKTVPNSTPGNFCNFDSAGQLVDSGKKLNDSGNGSADIWSAEKVLSVVLPDSQMKLVPSAPQKTLAMFDSTGQVLSSGKTVDDTLPASSAVIWTSEKFNSSVDEAAKTKMSLVQPVVANNFVVFDGKGQVIDGGVALNDSGVTEKDLWSSSKIQLAINQVLEQSQDLAASQIGAQTEKCQAKIDVASGVNQNNLSALKDLSTSLSTKMNLIPTAKPKDIAIFDSGGQATDSLMQFNDVGTSQTDVWSALKISSEISSVQSAINSKLAAQSSQQTTANSQIQTQITSLQEQEKNLENVLKTKMDLVPGAVNNRIGVFNGTGQIVDSGFIVDDSALSATVLWSSEKIKKQIDVESSLCSQSVSDVSNQIKAVTVVGKMDIQPTAKQNSVAIFNGSGQAVGSNYFINDMGTSTTDLWSAEKTTNAINTRVSYSGVPVVNDLAIWTSTSSVGDAKVSLNDSTTSTSNLWTAAKTKAYFDSQMLETYSKKCWFRGFVNEQVTIGSTLQNLTFTVTETANCTTVGAKTSVPLPRAGAYQINLWLLFYNASSANGKMLLFAPSSTQKLLMPIYVVNGAAAISYQTVCMYSSASSFTIPVQLVNVDGTTPATGSSITIQSTNSQGNLLSVQEM